MGLKISQTNVDMFLLIFLYKKQWIFGLKKSQNCGVFMIVIKFNQNQTRKKQKYKNFIEFSQIQCYLDTKNWISTFNSLSRSSTQKSTVAIKLEMLFVTPKYNFLPIYSRNITVIFSVFLSVLRRWNEISKSSLLNLNHKGKMQSLMWWLYKEKQILLCGMTQQL